MSPRWLVRAILAMTGACGGAPFTLADDPRSLDALAILDAGPDPSTDSPTETTSRTADGSSRGATDSSSSSEEPSSSFDAHGGEHDSSPAADVVDELEQRDAGGDVVDVPDVGPVRCTSPVQCPACTLPTSARCCSSAGACGCTFAGVCQ